MDVFDFIDEEGTGFVSLRRAAELLGFRYGQQVRRRAAGLGLTLRETRALERVHPQGKGRPEEWAVLAETVYQAAASGSARRRPRPPHLEVVSARPAQTSVAQTVALAELRLRIQALATEIDRLSFELRTTREALRHSTEVIRLLLLEEQSGADT